LLSLAAKHFLKDFSKVEATVKVCDRGSMSVIAWVWPYWCGSIRDHTYTPR